MKPVLDPVRVLHYFYDNIFTLIYIHVLITDIQKDYIIEIVKYTYIMVVFAIYVYI